MKYQSSADLKALARGQLLNHYSTPCLVCFFVLAVNFVLTLMGLFLFDTRTASGVLLFEFFNLLKNILLAFLGLGECLVFLKLSLGRETGFKDVFQGFSGHQNKVVKDALFLTIGEGLFMIPAAFIALTPPGLILFYPFYILGILGGFIFRLVYSQVWYLMLDFPSRSWTELLVLSRKKMRGNKFRLFLLYLSFLPLMLLVFLSFGVGALWVIPYLQSAKANFFLDLMRKS